MKFLLTSSGLTNQYITSALIDLLDKKLSDTSLLFIPTAANTDSGDKSWLIDNINAFKEQGFKSVDILDIAGLSRDEWEPHFQTAGVVCFGGGNEKYLARIIEETGIRDFLVTQFGSRVYMGISAGSMVAGNFLTDQQNEVIFSEENYTGEYGTPMKLLDIVFIPHLNSDWFSHVRKTFLESFHGTYEFPVYAMDDETALIINGDKIKVVGKGARWISKK